jgi:hypothetical protein
MMRSFAFFLLALAHAPAADLSQAVEEKPARSDRLALLSDKRINESSGLAPSCRIPDLFWTLNDSGGPTTVYALNSQGQTIAEIDVTNAKNIDWEDLASGPNTEAQPTLFIADIGDNAKARPSIQIYEIPDPKFIPVSKPQKIAPTRTWNLRYPDGPANAETLLVHPKTGRLHILTKTFLGTATLYIAPAPPPPDTVQVLEKITTLNFPLLNKPGKRPIDNLMTTGGSLSSDATRLLIATYNSLYEWTLPDGQLTAKALDATPIRINPPLTRQMEAVCYEPNSLHILFTSEIPPAPLYRLQRN